ncbi:hypothetical protein PIB30_004911 [Stylosanthes scabra]|uniref:Protein kinase domain-containing protein n=1 Tax=Stylosanthes scabra TaxID=79078 RepID=A0ABU6W367_9FABA|nr:hypothetical protein [Stylosanthes scabra]
MQFFVLVLNDSQIPADFFSLPSLQDVLENNPICYEIETTKTFCKPQQILDGKPQTYKTSVLQLLVAALIRVSVLCVTVPIHTLVLANRPHDFSLDNKLANGVGSGGYGKVYKGTLPSGQLIAIKRAQKESKQGGLEFKAEIELLSRVYHKNVENQELDLGGIEG